MAHPTLQPHLCLSFPSQLSSSKELPLLNVSIILISLSPLSHSKQGTGPACHQNSSSLGHRWLPRHHIQETFAQPHLTCPLSSDWHCWPFAPSGNTLHLALKTNCFPGFPVSSVGLPFSFSLSGPDVLVPFSLYNLFPGDHILTHSFSSLWRIWTFLSPPSASSLNPWPIEPTFDLVFPCGSLQGNLNRP